MRFLLSKLFLLLAAFLVSVMAVVAQTSCVSGDDFCVFLPSLQKAVEPTFTPAPPTITVPPPTATSLPPTATPVPRVVSLKSSQGEIRSGALYVVGEIENGLIGPVYFVKISGRFYDAQNNLIAADYTYSHLERVMPGQRSPFRLIVSNIPTSYSYYLLDLSYQTSSIFGRRDATVISQNVRDNFGVEVFGEIRNDSQSIIGYAIAVVTFYDASGEVVYVDWSYAAETQLQPGQTTIYSIKTFRNDLAYASYIVQSQGGASP